MKQAHQDDVVRVMVSARLVRETLKMDQDQSRCAWPWISSPDSSRDGHRSPRKTSAPTAPAASEEQVDRVVNGFNTMKGTFFLTTEDVHVALRQSIYRAEQLSLSGTKSFLLAGEEDAFLLPSERMFRSMTRKSGSLPHYMGGSGDHQIVRQDITGVASYPMYTELWLYFAVPTLILFASTFWHTGIIDSTLTLSECALYLDECDAKYLLSFHFHVRGALNHLMHLLSKGEAGSELLWSNKLYNNSVSIIGVPVHRAFLIQELETLRGSVGTATTPIELWHRANLEVMIGVKTSLFRISRWSMENIHHFVVRMQPKNMVQRWRKDLTRGDLLNIGHIVVLDGVHHFYTNILRSKAFAEQASKLSTGKLFWTVEVIRHMRRTESETGVEDEEGQLVFDSDDEEAYK